MPKVINYQHKNGAKKGEKTNITFANNPKYHKLSKQRNGHFLLKTPDKTVDVLLCKYKS